MSAQQQSTRQFSLSEIRQATDDFATANVIGEGGEGTVYKGFVCVETRRVSVAVKRLKPNTQRFEEEIKTLTDLHHPNLVSLVGYCKDSSERILVYDYMCNGSVADFLYGDREGPSGDSPCLSWEQRLNICIDAARGLEYLHTGTTLPKGILHRDVKPGNILLDENWGAKISDFGLVKLTRASQTHSTITTNPKGSHGYLAPEYVLYRRVTRKIDVYALGAVLFEVLCRKNPWQRQFSYYPGDEEDEEDENLGLWAQKNVDPELRETISQNSLETFSELVHKCLKHNPRHRPNMSEVVKELERALELHRSDANLSGIKDRIVLYYTSSEAVKKIAEDCRKVRAVLKGCGALIDERDIKLDPEFGEEFAGMFKVKGLGVPQLLIGGKYIGGVDEIRKLYAKGELEVLVEGFPWRDPDWVCETCEDSRFVPCPKEKCSECNKHYTGGNRRDCNKNGLVPCPTCCAWKLEKLQL